MKANEVMLGDWVYNEVPCYVTAIYHNGTMDCQGDDWAISTDRVEPLPLTVEILVKNGFQQISTNKYISGKVTIAIFVKEFLITIKSGNARVMITIKYVHELQHALRLCGIEKKIEL